MARRCCKNSGGEPAIPKQKKICGASGWEKITLPESASKKRKLCHAQTPCKPLAHILQRNRQHPRGRREGLKIFGSKKKLPIADQQKNDALHNGQHQQHF